MKRIGILADTFDPVHAGHLAFAQTALENCKLDKIFFLVEPTPRRKQGVKAFEHRVKMVKLAIKGVPQFGSIVLEDTQFNVTDTLPKLRNRFGKQAELYMLMGEDVLAHLTNWPHVKDLVETVHIVVGARKVSASKIRQLVQSINKTRGLEFEYTVVSTPQSILNSSRVRQSLRGGQIPSDVPPTVARYIIRHKLYSAGVS